MADLEKDKDKQINKLRRKSCQTITRINISGLEDDYAHLKDIHSRFNFKADDWIELLDTDEEGDPIYPAAGMPESRYNPDNKDVAKKISLME